MIVKNHFAQRVDLLVRDKRCGGIASLESRPKGYSYCETCCTIKPRKGVSRKGWQCADCRAAATKVSNSAARD